MTEEAEKENQLLKSLLYCTTVSCDNCGRVDCENFQRQRIDSCSCWVSFKDKILTLQNENKILKKENLNARDAVTMQMYTNKANKEMMDRQLSEVKYLLLRLINNAPDTYSGTNIELQQEKMFAFQNAVNEAKDFIKEK